MAKIVMFVEFVGGPCDGDFALVVVVDAMSLSRRDRFCWRKGEKRP